MVTIQWGTNGLLEDEPTALQRARDRLRHSKEAMDRASDAYDEALRNWHAAIAECDRLEANT